MDWFFNFPDMSRSDLREFKKTVDFAFTDFSRTYGQGIEEFFEPLLMFLVWFEKLFINTPWPIIIFSILLLAWIGSRSILIENNFEYLYFLKASIINFIYFTFSVGLFYLAFFSAKKNGNLINIGE